MRPRRLYLLPTSSLSFMNASRQRQLPCTPLLHSFHFSAYFLSGVQVFTSTFIYFFPSHFLFLLILPISIGSGSDPLLPSHKYPFDHPSPLPSLPSRSLERTCLPLRPFRSNRFLWFSAYSSLALHVSMLCYLVVFSTDSADPKDGLK